MRKVHTTDDRRPHTEGVQIIYFLVEKHLENYNLRKLILFTLAKISQLYFGQDVCNQLFCPKSCAKKDEKDKQNIVPRTGFI